MNFDEVSQPPEGCEAIKQQVSDAADAGAALAAEVEAHLRSCDACRDFAATWFAQPPAVLVQPVPVTDDGLRERILGVAARPEVIPFPGATARRPEWSVWCRRLAACLVLGGLAYWLLNPTPTPVHRQDVAMAPPTLAQSLAKVEGNSKREQQLVQTALVHGGERVQGDMEWTMSALDL